MTRLCECGCGEPTPLSDRTSKERGQVFGEPMPFVPGHRIRVRGQAHRFDEFWALTDCGCWEWTAGRHSGGYGTLRFNGKTVYAHRFSYERANGPIPAGMQLDHICGNRLCVNPDHLEVVTSAENTRRGRASKLTHQQVEQIRQLASDGWMLRDIAVAYGVHGAHVSRICSGEAWT